MSTFSVGGLSSGLDTKSIVSQLLQLDARPKMRSEWNKQLWESRKSVWTEVNSRLLALQGKANVLTNPSTWSGAIGVTSSDPTRATGKVSGSNPATGTYALEVQQLAAVERWDAANGLAAATGGSRQSGTWWSGSFTQAGAGTLLTSMTEVDGTSVGLTAGSTITLSASVDGTPVTGSYSVTSTSTLDDVMQWAETQFPGATFSVGTDGTVVYQSAAGTTNEIESLSFTAVDGTGTALTSFNASEGAQSTFAAAPSGGSVADTLTFTQGTSTWSVSVGAGSDEATIAAAINGTAGIGVTASVVNGRLRIDAAADSGASGAFTVTSAASLATDLGLARTVAGQDSKFTIDGTAYTRSKNSDITDVLTDVSLNLLQTTTSPVTLNIGASAASASDMRKKAQEFVDAYNSIVDYIQAKTSEQKVFSPKNLQDYLKGPMARDYQLSSVSFELRRFMTDTIDGLADSGNALDDLGITTGAVSASFDPSNTLGRLTIDDAKFEAAFIADPKKVQTVFMHTGGAAGASDDGIARRVSTLVSQWRVGGKVDMALDGATRRISDLQNSIERMEDRLEQRRKYYERMFSSLETTLGRLQSQGSWLSGQLANLSQR